MARNKHPEETVDLIMDTAATLFLTKGYDKTSLQDIIGETKLSKGAIYHHFASKEEIFVRICERMGAENAAVLAKVRDSKTLNGQEKLKEIFRQSLLFVNHDRILKIMPYLLDSPQFFAREFHSIFEEVAPEFIEPILRDGLADGSIRTDHPKELAEVLILLADIWLNPMLQPTTPEEVRGRCACYNDLTRPFGLELLDEELISVLAEYAGKRQEQ